MNRKLKSSTEFYEVLN